MKLLKIAMILSVVSGVAGVASAQETLSPEQVRTRIMDTCMVSLSREVSQTQPIYPACNCYATGLAKIMDERETAAYAKTQQVSSRLTPQAKDIYAQCRAKSKV